MLLWEYHKNANDAKGLELFQQFLTVKPDFSWIFSAANSSPKFGWYPA